MVGRHASPMRPCYRIVCAHDRVNDNYARSTLSNRSHPIAPHARLGYGFFAIRINISHNIPQPNSINGIKPKLNKREIDDKNP